MPEPNDRVLMRAVSTAYTALIERAAETIMQAGDICPPEQREHLRAAIEALGRAQWRYRDMTMWEMNLQERGNNPLLSTEPNLMPGVPGHGQ